MSATVGRPATAQRASAFAKATADSGPTVEQALYAVLFVAALGVRFFSLGDLNLVSPWEAAQIWPAWVDHAGSALEDSGFPDPRPPASPLLYALQRGLFLVTGGGSSFWARFPSACAGAGLVLAAWALRRQMGRGGALMAAGLFAFDPWLLSFSRLAEGSTLSVLTFVLLLGVLFDAGGEDRRVMRLAVVGGLFLISGPLAWLLLPVLFYAIFLLGGGPFVSLSPSLRRRAAIVCAAVVIAGSTALLAQPAGLSTVGESVATAIAYLSGSSVAAGMAQVDHSYTVRWALLRFLVDEPFLVAFGGSGLVVALYRIVFFAGSRAGQKEAEATAAEGERPFQADSIWQNVLLVCAAWGFLLIVMPGRTPVSLLVLGLPFLLLAAESAARMLRQAPLRVVFLDSAHMPAFATMGILLVTAFFWTGNITGMLRNGTFDPRLTVFYLLIPALGAFFVWWSGERASGLVFGLLTFLALLLAQASSSWMLNLWPEYDHSRTVYAESGAPGIALLADDIAQLSSIRTGDPSEAPVYLQARSSDLPFLVWHLRYMRDLRWRPGIELTEVEADALIVSRAGEWGEGERLPEQFVGSRYTVTQRWLPTELESLGALLRWMLFRERQQGPGGIPVRQEVELWVQREK